MDSDDLAVDAAKHEDKIGVVRSVFMFIKNITDEEMRESVDDENNEEWIKEILKDIYY